MKCIKLSDLFIRSKLISSTMGDEICFVKVCTDTRKFQEGDIFICIKGLKYDSHELINEKIIEKSSCIVTEKKMGLAHEVSVDSTLLFIHDLANYIRINSKYKVFGISGSNGKTTTKELLLHLLSLNYKTHGTEYNNNNQYGVPFTIFLANDDVELLVLEMGISHQGDMDLLSATVQPDVSILTNIGWAHIENFNSEPKLLIKEKKKLFNHDATFLKIIGKVLHDHEKLIDEKRLLEDASYLVSNDSIKICYKNKIFKLINPAIGVHNIESVIFSIDMAIRFGLEQKEIESRLNSFDSIPGRFETIKCNHKTIINDSYNSNPVSLKYGLENMFRLYEKNVTLVIGEMLELGMFSEKLHIEIFQLIKEIGFKEVYFKTNQETLFTILKEHFTGLRKIHSKEDFKLEISKSENNVIYFKGSNSIKLSEQIDWIMSQ